MAAVTIHVNIPPDRTIRLPDDVPTGPADLVVVACAHDQAVRAGEEEHPTLIDRDGLLIAHSNGTLDTEAFSIGAVYDERMRGLIDSE